MTGTTDNLLNADAVRRFIETVHVMATAALTSASQPGCLQLVRIHPTEDNASFQFPLGAVEPMVAQALADARAGYNVYVEGRTVEPRPKGNKERGKLDQTRAVFALVVDDDADKGKAARPGPEPSLTVETSPGNRHLWYFLDRALTVEQAVPLGEAMRAASGADADTGVVTQPYRVAGTPNQPSAAKVARGRTPSRTRILEAGGPTYSLEALQAIFPAIKRQHEQPRQESAQKGSQGWREMENLAAVRVEQMKERDRSRHFQKCVTVAAARGLSPDDLEDILRRHPQGCAGKYLDPDRLRREINRSWAKVKAQAGAPEESADWLQDCLLDQAGRPIPNLANTMLALRRDPALADAFAFDDMACLPMLTREMPKAGVPGSVCDPRPVTDQDGGALQEYLQHLGLPRVPRDTVFQALDMRAHERAFHPVRDYLARLHWDGQKRIDDWLTYYLGAERNSYTGAVGAMFFIAMVARVMKPGCKADHLLVLEGKQGAGKSTACGILGGRWFSDAMPDITHGKDAASHLAGKWLIEVGEMHALGRAEATLLKSFITRTTEQYRPAYARLEVKQPRQCVFIATTNQEDYLNDPSGGRRFWPVKVGAIDTNALAQDRDQLFAEAVHAFRAGRQWWPDADFERDQIAPEQEARFKADPWEQAVTDFFKDHAKATVTEIAKRALGFDTDAKIGTADANRIRNVLKSLGMTQQPKDWRGNRYWSRP